MLTKLFAKVLILTKDTSASNYGNSKIANNSTHLTEIILHSESITFCTHFGMITAPDGHPLFWNWTTSNIFWPGEKGFSCLISDSSELRESLFQVPNSGKLSLYLFKCFITLTVSYVIILLSFPGLKVKVVENKVLF